MFRKCKHDARRDRGTVVDTSGAVVPGAAVTLHNDATGAKFKLAADAAGYFKAPLVPPGTHTVAIRFGGDGTYKRRLPVRLGFAH